jgi:hypothetical protein
MKKESMKYIGRDRLTIPTLDAATDTTFSKHEIFGNLSLSLDSIRRRLLISRIVNKIRQYFQIELKSTRLISIKKVYKDIYVGQLKYKRLEEFLETIYLQFEFFDGRNAIHLPIFDRGHNKLCELPEIEKKLDYWQDLLSEMRLIKDK